MSDRSLITRLARMARIDRLDRRQFLQLTGIAGGGLILGINVGCSADQAPPESTPSPDTFQPNAYLEISERGIHIHAPIPEIGQGVKTSLPMILAEELDVAWQDVTIVEAQVHPDRGRQNAGGSRSIQQQWMPMRRAGATARHLLVAAAALRWEVDVGECETRDGQVFHRPTGRQASYLELAGAAARLPLPDPDDVVLKTPSQFRILGKRVSGADNLPLVTGEPLFGLDTQLAELSYATYVKCPARGGKVRGANLDVVRKLPGVIDAFSLEGNGNPAELSAGVAIVASDTWSAFKARDVLEVDWDETHAAADSTRATREEAMTLAAASGSTTIVDKGNVSDAFGSATQTIDAFYEYAFVNHAQMEPQNTTAWWRDGTLEVWAPTQNPTTAKRSISRVLKLDEQNITIHRRRAGGGFGRRARNDPVVEAAAIARRIRGPVKLTWTREDDMAYGFYRAGGFHALAGALDVQGSLVGWRNHFISFTADGRTPVTGGNIMAEIDPGPFVPNYQITQTLLPWTTPCGPWRAPRSNVVAFAHQGFLHELSSAADRDHLEFLLALLGEPRWLDEGNPNALHTGRAAGVIRRAAEEAGWGREMAAGSGLGLAFYFSHSAHVAEVAEVSVSEDKEIDVTRVTVAADVGPIVNLSGAENQVQGAVVDGLSTMLGQQMTFEDGRAQQSNFHEYPLLRMPRAPEVDVHFIQSNYPPSGLGEPALPPLAPAVANAVFAATGERIRRLPVINDGWQ